MKVEVNKTVEVVLHLDQDTALAVMKHCGKNSINSCREKLGMTDDQARASASLFTALEDAGLSY